MFSDVVCENVGPVLWYPTALEPRWRQTCHFSDLILFKHCYRPLALSKPVVLTTQRRRLTVFPAYKTDAGSRRKPPPFILKYR
jgi:hypothetical protein